MIASWSKMGGVNAHTPSRDRRTDQPAAALSDTAVGFADAEHMLKPELVKSG
jgi:hypothetical protein